MLTPEQIDNAIKAIKLVKELPSESAASERFHLYDLALDVVRYLGNYGYEGGSFFTEEFSADFEKMPFFNGASPAGASFDNIQLFYVFSYALFFEKALISKTFGDLDSRVLHFYFQASTIFSSGTFYRLELFRGRIIANFRDVEIKKQVEKIGQQRAELENGIKPIEAKIDQWGAQLDQWQSRVNALESKIKNEYGKLNFVGLSDAFSKMISKKNWERRSQVALMWMIAIVLMVLPVSPVLLAHYEKRQLTFSLDWLIGSVPLAVAELMLLYFFRIALRNFYSVKAQLLQLDLRYHVCAFIQGYAEFLKKSRPNQDAAFLDKFDSLVFSGITANIENIPSQFDGLDSLLSLIRELKAAGK